MSHRTALPVALGVAVLAACAPAPDVPPGVPPDTALGAPEVLPHLVEEHCVVRVVGVEETGAFITEPWDCHETFAGAMAALGAVPPPGALPVQELVRRDLLAQVDQVLGVHYDGSNRTGSTITVTGADCGGGYLNLSSGWINRISSTLNGCAAVRFYDGYDKGGSYQTTTPATVNLGALDNAANSVGYATA